MSSYSYCSGCDAGLEKPTLEEQINDEWHCHCCGRHQHLLTTEADTLMEMAQRILELEATVRKLQNDR